MDEKEFFNKLMKKSSDYGSTNSDFCIIPADLQQFIKWCEKKQIEVVSAIIIHKDTFLCVQRNTNKYDYISKKYEFPGGKMEIGESKMETLIREIKEELNINLTNITFFSTINHEYPDFNLKMHSFICKVSDTKLVLNEHIDFKWLPKSELSTLDWAGADIPIVNKLITQF